MAMVKGDFIDGSAVIYKKSGGKLIKGLKLGNGLYKWFDRFWVGDFHCGRAVIDDGRKMGYINRLGEVCIPLRFNVALDFSENRAFVSSDDSTLLIDDSGSVIASFEESLVPGAFSNGTALLSRIVCSGSHTEEALIDLSGNIIVDFAQKRMIRDVSDILIGEQASPWHEGIFSFISEGRRGVSDIRGNVLMEDAKYNPYYPREE